MSFTGVDNLDRSIDKANAWLADMDSILPGPASGPASPAAAAGGSAR